jgi:hypothetical protein
LEMRPTFFISLFLLAAGASLIRGQPTKQQQQTTLEATGILTKSQPTVASDDPSASRWPTLAEAITNAELLEKNGSKLRPSASLLGLLEEEEAEKKNHSSIILMKKSEKKIKKIKMTKQKKRKGRSNTAAAADLIMTSSTAATAADRRVDRRATEQGVVMTSSTTTAERVTSSAAATKVAAIVIDVAEMGISTDLGWNEDNIKFDFMTGKIINIIV